MKRLALLAFLPLLLAADWPKKGDTVYLAAELHEHTPALPFIGGSPDVDLKSCVPLTQLYPSSRFKDDRGGLHALIGDWSKYLHRTEEECEAAVAANGLPRVTSQGYRHKLP